jgi:hypothetical protein
MSCFNRNHSLEIVSEGRTLHTKLHVELMECMKLNLAKCGKGVHHMAVMVFNELPYNLK